jgi:hypothetical protein
MMATRDALASGPEGLREMITEDDEAQPVSGDLAAGEPA